MSNIGKFVQTPAERIERVIDYSDWLRADEVIVAFAWEVTPEGNVPAALDYNIAGDGKSVDVFTYGGDDQAKYVFIVTITTNRGEIKQDEILFNVKDLA